MENLRYNLTPSARRVDRYISKALIGMFSGGIISPVIGTLIVWAQFPFLPELLEGHYYLCRWFLDVLPRVWFEGTAVGIVTGVFVGLTNAWHTERKLKF